MQQHTINLSTFGVTVDLAKYNPAEDDDGIEITIKSGEAYVVTLTGHIIMGVVFSYIHNSCNVPKITTIKWLRDKLGTSLLETKDIVEMITGEKPGMTVLFPPFVAIAFRDCIVKNGYTTKSF